LVLPFFTQLGWEESAVGSSLAGSSITFRRVTAGREGRPRGADHQGANGEPHGSLMRTTVK
jgi:hypothetical protein